MRKTPFKPILSFLLFLCLKILFSEMGVAQNTTFIPVNVGVALDLGSDLDGKIALSCINMAVSDFYANHGDYKTRMVLTTGLQERCCWCSCCRFPLCPPLPTS
uniref:Uncharacterized protein n=1 Tax=Salix viminalis TaxID=40686 RepID=A0A6N2MAV6_SALVM